MKTFKLARNCPDLSGSACAFSMQKLVHASASTFLFSFFCITSAFPQPPGSFNYQAIVRDASGAVKANTYISVTFSILQGNAGGTVVFTETHNTGTNDMGLITLSIGSVNEEGFESIDWTAGPYFLKVEVDGTAFGTSPLLSVPYAMHAETVEVDKVDDADADPDNEIQTLDLDGNVLTLSSGGGSVILPSSGGADNWGTQTIVTDATLNGNGTAASPLKIAQHSATSGQVLKWNGTTWYPENNISDGLVLPYIDSAYAPHYDNVFQIICRGGYASNAIVGIAKSDQGAGILGKNISGITSGSGVKGTTNSPGGSGVIGDNGNSEGDGWGVSGYSHGLLGGGGVQGQSWAETGKTYGVKGYAFSSSGYGVFGSAKKYGIYGQSYESKGRAITGEAVETASIGVYGIALEENSTGVWGEGALYDFYAAGPGTNYGSGSSIRWKRNIVLISEPLEKIKAIRGVYFDWDEAHGGNHDVGMIAEEVGKVLPEVVAYEENGIDASGMDYSKTTPLLVEGIKALLKEIELLKAVNKNLKTEQKILMEKITEIEAGMK